MLLVLEQLDRDLKDERAREDPDDHERREHGCERDQRKGEDRQCIDGLESDCGKWRVIREYRCLQTSAN